ncbi:MAG TPA: tRNA (adenosine(37)-N6)-threonylcarbamoyltransferase complex dimerization subunit type 1 TsaB [Gammaproteobacteria bacterium]
MKLLVFDTSTDACSCATYVDGAVTERHEIAPRRHAQLLLGMIDQTLAESGVTLSSLDAIAFGRGPGSFTGVRIAAATAQALALGADVPVVPVSSLAALAQGVHAENGASRIAAALDARMDEVYWGVYEAGEDALVRASQPERVCAPRALPPLEGGNWTGAGGGWQAYGAELHRKFEGAIVQTLSERHPTAGAAALLAADAYGHGGGVEARDALPVYLRDRVTRA